MKDRCKNKLTKIAQKPLIEYDVEDPADYEIVPQNKQRARFKAANINKSYSLQIDFWEKCGERKVKSKFIKNFIIFFQLKD